MVKRGSIFTHYKGDKYVFETIAHPKSDMPNVENELVTMWFVTHTETLELMYIIQPENSNIYYATNYDEYFVIYRRQDTTKSELWARPVGMFFEHTDGGVKRFKEEASE